MLYIDEWQQRRYPDVGRRLAELDSGLAVWSQGIRSTRAHKASLEIATVYAQSTHLLCLRCTRVQSALH